MIERKKKKCKGCGELHFIWSHGNCKLCAYKEKKPKKIGHSAKRKTVVERDTEFFMEIWKERSDENGDHWCEECILKYGKKIRAYLGPEPKRGYFSHNLTKGAHPALRRVKENITLLCTAHHSQYEFGKRHEMLIYEKLKPVIQRLRDIENSNQ